MGGSTSKTFLRKDLKDRLRVFTQVPTLKSAADAAIVSKVKSLITNSTGIVAGFNSLSDEPDLSLLYTSLANPIVFPKLSETDSSLIQFTRVENYISEKWEVSSLGFKHPSSVQAVGADEITFMLVPGLGFSSRGERLGRGKGFYDRYLQNFKGLKVGVCFDCQWNEGHLPTDSWDIGMDYIVTETKCVKIEG